MGKVLITSNVNQRERIDKSLPQLRFITVAAIVLIIVPVKSLDKLFDLFGWIHVRAIFSVAYLQS